MAPGHSSTYKTPVIVNGLPGKMATLIAEAVVKSDDFYLFPFTLTGKKERRDVLEISGKNVETFSPSHRDYFLDMLEDIPRVEEPIMIDFTAPDAVNSNADFYCENKFSFVMGTTGGDRKALEDRVRASNVSAVIAPNMAKQIVALQSFMQNYSEQNADSLMYCDLGIIESHQSTKKDTSGTAKAMVQYFNRLGIKFDVEDIMMIRDSEEQLKKGIPKEHLTGHGWHSYVINPRNGVEGISKFFDSTREFLTSSSAFNDYPKLSGGEQTNGNLIYARASRDMDVVFKLTRFNNGFVEIAHNVNGRSIYVDGVMDALRFGKKALKERGKVYSMIDVLKAQD